MITDDIAGRIRSQNIFPETFKHYLKLSKYQKIVT